MKGVKGRYVLMLFLIIEDDGVMMVLIISLQMFMCSVHRRKNKDIFEFPIELRNLFKLILRYNNMICKVILFPYSSFCTISLWQVYFVLSF